MSEEDKTEKEFKKNTAALEQQLLTLIEGQDTAVIYEAMLLVIHRVTGSLQFGRLLLGSSYR